MTRPTGRARPGFRAFFRIGVHALAAAIVLPGIAAGQENADGDAAARNGADAPAPTFQEVMQNPGDLELSFRYARAQIRQGNLPSAMTTLERILLIEPDLQDVRLMYGIVLYRLGDLSSAEAELEKVDPAVLPANLKSELERYRRRIAEAQRKTTVTLDVATGFAHETNPTATSDNGDVVVFDIPLRVEEGESDASWLVDARGEVRHELDTQTPVTVFGQAYGSVREYFEANSQDVLYGALRGGATVRTLDFDLTGTLTGGGMTLSDEDFYSFIGPGLRLERPLDGHVTAFLDGSWRVENFEEIDESTTADDRSGHRFEVRSGLEGVITPNVRASLSVGMTRKLAREDFEEYVEPEARASVTAIVFENHFVQGAVNVGRRHYDANDPFISATERRDTYARFRLSYGLPLRFSEDLPEALDGVRLVPSVEYYHQWSNIPNFEYDNFTTKLMVSKHFQF